jgi:hypothetical protein
MNAWNNAPKFHTINVGIMMVMIKIFPYRAVKIYTIKITLSKSCYQGRKLVDTLYKALVDHDLNSEQRALGVIKFIVLSHS